MADRARVSRGQWLVELIEAYINRYVALPSEIEGQSLVLALWAIHTWMYERFSSTPYLAITAATKQAGKTLCMEVLGLICRGSQQLATLRPLALLRVIRVHEGRVTLFVDEAEKLSSAAIGDLRSIFTTGYRRGGEHIVTKQEEYTRYTTFCPKAFALIGDVMDVVRDRSITVHLRRGVPAADFLAEREAAEGEAEAIEQAIRGYFVEVPAMVQPMFLGGREREIWTVLFSIAAALKLDSATMEKLERSAADLVGLKSLEARRYSSEEAEAEAGQDTAGDRAIKDLREVLKGESFIASAEAVARLKAIPTSPWRTFKGQGLNEIVLANLVSRFGVRPRTRNVRTGGAGKGGTGKGKQVGVRGYFSKDVNASVGGEA